MALLQKIRTNLVAQLAIGLGMVAFIVTGFVTCSRGPREQETTVAKLNGEELDRQSFDSQVEEFKNILRIVQQKPLDYNFTSEEDAQIREQVYQRFVQKNLLEKECSTLGLTVTDNELANIIKEGTHPLLTQLPLFLTQNRTFDYAGLQQFLKQYSDMQSNSQVTADQMMQMELIHSAWMFVEKELRTATLSDKYQNLLCSLILSNPVSAKASFEARNNETDVVMAALPYATIADTDIKVEESELKAKLAEYQNAYWRNPNTGEEVQFYALNESREVKYIDVNIKPSDADQEAINNAMNEYATALQAEGANIDSIVAHSKSLVSYTKMPMGQNTIRRIDADAAARIDSLAVGAQSEVYMNPADTTLNIVRLLGRVSRPDSVEVREIGIQNMDVAAAKVTADSIINALNAGEVFDSIAKRYNQPGTKHWITSNMYEGATLSDQDREYIESAITASTGEYKTIEMEGGVLLMQITDRRQMEEKFDVAIIKRKIDFSQETFKDYMNKLATFVNNCKDAKEIEEKAVKEGYTVQKENVYKNTHSLSRVAGTREIVRWAYNDDTEIGNILDPKAYGSNSDHLVVAVLSSIAPAGKATLDNEKVKEAIGLMVVADKKAAMLQDKMKSAKSIADVAKIQGAVQDSIQHITFSSPAYIMKLGAQEMAVSGAASSLAEGKFVAGVRGNSGVYALQAVKKNKNAETYDEKAEMQRNAMQNASFVSYMFQMGNSENVNSIFYPVLKGAKMVDNRHIFF